MNAKTIAFLREEGGKTEGFDGRRMRFYALSLRLFALQKSTSLSDGGIGLCNHSAPKLPIYIRREATPQLFTIHFSLFTRVSAKPQFISYNLKFLYIFLAFI